MIRAQSSWRESRSRSTVQFAWRIAWLGVVWAATPATDFAQTTKPQASPGEVSYQCAVAKLESGAAADEVLQLLSKAIEAGWNQPSRVLIEPAWTTFRRAAESRAQLREWMKAHACESDLSITAADEPGRKLELTLSFRDQESNEPLTGRTVYLYQTDDAGDYMPEAASVGGGSDNPRLFAVGRTDPSGQLRIRSIVPGCYRGTRNPRHFHLQVERPGSVPYGTGLYFDSGNDLDDELREEAARGRVFAAKLPAGDDVAKLQVELRIPGG